MRKLIWLLGGALALVLVIAAGALILLKTRANGFSARSQPSALEKFVAQTARKIAIPRDAKNKQNRVPNSAEVLAEAKQHWADHCATCHANDGSGENTIGRQMYPPTPDMRKPHTQQMSDGELFYITENGIRLSGMPAWGTGTDEDAQDSWKLVHFIRRLPSLSADEIKEMEKMNPKSVADLDEERQKEEFLKGRSPIEPPKQHTHH